MYVAVTAAGVVGQTADLSALLELSGPARGMLSFALVLLAGVGLLKRRESDVHRAVDIMAEGFPLTMIYGAIAFGLLVFSGSYIITQLGRLTSRAVVFQVSLAVLGLAIVVLGGFGYLVVGTWLTEIEGARQPLAGAVIGAGLSAAPWVALPELPALFGWILLATVGLGNVTREWVHGERTVEAESDG